MFYVFEPNLWLNLILSFFSGLQARLALDIVSANASVTNNQWHNTNGASSIEPALLRRIAHELGAQPAQLHRDMKHLLDSGNFLTNLLFF